MHSEGIRSGQLGSGGRNSKQNLSQFEAIFPCNMQHKSGPSMVAPSAACLLQLVQGLTMSIGLLGRVPALLDGTAVLSAHALWDSKI